MRLHTPQDFLFVGRVVAVAVAVAAAVRSPVSMRTSYSIYGGYIGIPAVEINSFHPPQPVSILLANSGILLQDAERECQQLDN